MPDISRLNRFDFDQSLRQRERHIEDINSVSGGDFELYGEVPVHGPGWATFDLLFPVRFVELPTVRDGWHLVDNQVINPRNLPTVRVSVKSWITTSQSPIYYTGATMLIVAHGPTDLWVKAHYTLTGKALRYPLEAANAGMGG